MTTLEQAIREAVRAELAQVVAELRQLLGQRPAEDRYLSISKAAELAEVHPDSLRGWLKAGELPTHHAGRELRVKLSELERFMATGSRGVKGARPSVEEEASAALARARK